MQEKFYKNSKPGLDRIRAYFWSEIIPLNMMSRFRTFLGPSKTGRISRKILFPPMMRPGYDFFDFYMTKTQALFIASLRTNGNCCTQRYLSEAWVKRFPFTNVSEGDQYDGRWLAEYAAEILKNPEIAG